MENNEILNIIITQCLPEDDDKFNKWYNEVHIPMLLLSQKVKSVTRYKVISKPPLANQYVAIWRFRDKRSLEEHTISPERTAAVSEMKETWGNRVQVTYFPSEPIQDWRC